MATATGAEAMTAGRDAGGRASVSVAVATCGRPQALGRCLAALAHGTVRPAELIVVDQDPSAQAREAVRACGVEVSYLEQPRLGLSASRNLALAHAGGAVLAVTDDDCVPERDWVAAVAAAFARDPQPVAVSGPILPLGPQPPGAHAISLRCSTAARDFSGRVLPWDVGSGANFAARRSVLLAQGGWDERLGVGSAGQAAEDADLLDRILRAGGTIRFDPAVIVRHDWQTWARRLLTRSSYAHGIGALCGLRLRAGDRFALRMLLAYGRLHTRRLATAVRRRERARAAEHARALTGVLPGLVYGARAAGRPANALPREQPTAAPAS